MFMSRNEVAVSEIKLINLIIRLSKVNSNVQSISHPTIFYQRKRPKAPLNGPANLARSFLAGILSESIFDSDWSPIRFRNIKILSLKRAQSIHYISRLNENYV